MNNVVPIAQIGLLSESDPNPETQITFDNFWALFPRKDAKKPARMIWFRLNFDEQREAIIGIARWRRHLLRKDPEFIPMARTWLYQARWEDELPADIKVSAASHIPFAGSPDEPPRQAYRTPRASPPDAAQAHGAGMRVLIACERSGTVRDEFIRRGHDAMSCDIEPCDVTGPHYHGDVRDVLDGGWDMMIAHPPCTHLAVSGAKHFHRKAVQQQEGLDFVCLLRDAQIPRIAIENPVSIISTRLGKPTQIIQPWQFGDEYQKTTCLWLFWLPPLMPTKIVGRGEFYVSPTGKKLPLWYSNDKSAKGRSKTFQGIAEAMGDQWGSLPVQAAA